MRRSVLVALVAWLGVVVAGSTMTWATINTAGQEVLSPGPVPTGDADVPAPAATDRTPPMPSPSATDPRSPATSPTTRTAEPTRDPSRGPTQAPPTRAAPTAEAPRSSTWRGVAGAVTVSCSGSAIALQAASPNNGYAVEVRERGPEEVEVRLESDEEETRVEATCADGRPQFNVTM